MSRGRRGRRWWSSPTTSTTSSSWSRSSCGARAIEVVTAPDGEQALRLIHERVPDLCVLDGMMPGLAGFQVLREIRADQRTAGIRVLILTATVDEEREIRRHGVEPDAL